MASRSRTHSATWSILIQSPPRPAAANADVHRRADAGVDVLFAQGVGQQPVERQPKHHVKEPPTVSRNAACPGKYTKTDRHQRQGRRQQPHAQNSGNLPSASRMALPHAAGSGDHHRIRHLQHQKATTPPDDHDDLRDDEQRLVLPPAPRKDKTAKAPAGAGDGGNACFQFLRACSIKSLTMKLPPRPVAGNDRAAVAGPVMAISGQRMSRYVNASEYTRAPMSAPAGASASICTSVSRLTPDQIAGPGR